jgi:phospholipid/cholesterol/gamma-HCH transport system substrate-binding protein
MRPVSQLEMRVGLLIVAGLVATVVMILAADHLHFERVYRVSAIVVDAGGLRAHSPVTLSGIRIGEVESLGTISDPRGSIRVQFKVNQDFKIPVESSLTISSSGIFGDSFLAFAGPLPGAKPSGKTLATDGTAEVTAGKGFLDKVGGQAEQIMVAAGDLLDKPMRDDVKRLIRNSADLAAAGTTLAEGLQQQNLRIADALDSIRRLADELHATTAALGTRTQATMDHLDATLAAVDKQVGALGTAGTATLGHLDALAARGAQLLDANAADLTATLASVRQLSEQAGRVAGALASGQGVIGQLLLSKDLVRDLNDTAIDLSRTANLMAEHPEVLVFGATKEETAALRARREREKLRRAFQEDYVPNPLLLQTAPVEKKDDRKGDKKPVDGAGR